jgi:hypothetical protein
MIPKQTSTNFDTIKSGKDIRCEKQTKPIKYKQ